jgi:hypothetical protein
MVSIDKPDVWMFKSGDFACHETSDILFENDAKPASQASEYESHNV